jgi:hypothetical protein
MRTLLAIGADDDPVHFTPAAQIQVVLQQPPQQFRALGLPI